MATAERLHPKRTGQGRPLESVPSGPRATEHDSRSKAMPANPVRPRSERLQVGTQSSGYHNFESFGFARGALSSMAARQVAAIA